MLKFLNRLLPTKYERKMTLLMTMIVLLVGVSLTVRLADQEQEIRQRASAPTTTTPNIPQPNENITPSLTLTIPPIDPLSTTFSLSLKISEITNPKSIIRPFTLSIFSTENELISSGTSPLSFQNGTYTGIINIGNLQSGTYTYKIATPGLLRSSSSTPLLVAKGQKITLPQLTMTPGDINNDGQIDATDYSILLRCHGSNTTQCDQNTKGASDFNGDRKIDQLDFDILIRNINK